MYCCDFYLGVPQNIEFKEVEFVESDWTRGTGNSRCGVRPVVRDHEGSSTLEKSTMRLIMC